MQQKHNLYNSYVNVLTYDVDCLYMQSQIVHKQCYNKQLLSMCIYLLNEQMYRIFLYENIDFKDYY